MVNGSQTKKTRNHETTFLFQWPFSICWEEIELFLLICADILKKYLFLRNLSLSETICIIHNYAVLSLLSAEHDNFGGFYEKQLSACSGN